jgi:hypothetical protein
MNKKEYMKWIDRKVHSFSNLLADKRNPAELLGYTMQNNNYRKEFTLRIDNFIIYVNLYTAETVIFNTKTMRSAKAKCHDGDTFNINEGIAIAWAKYNNEVIPQYENSIGRDELQNGDVFISSVNKNNVVTFIGWIPNCPKGLIGKWAIVLDEERKPLKTQVAEEVVKMN